MRRQVVLNNARLHSNLASMASSEARPHHRNQLPSWSRPGFGRHTSDIRTLHRDRVPLASSRLEFSPESSHDFQQRVFQLEKNIAFLKQQHLETLQQLHEEIERLKKENRELSFRLIMCRCGRSGKPRASRRVRPTAQSSMSGEETDPETPNDELRVILLEEEVRDLRKTVATERNKNARLMRIIEQKVLEQRTTDQSDGSELRLGGTKPASTVQECEMIIKQLQSRNTQQQHELIQIKADLRDVLYSHKWTPDAYLLARAYVPDKEEERSIGLPKVAAPPQKSKETLDRAYQRVSEGVSLPALRPRLSTNMAEKQRRSQALRGRGGGRERTVL